MNAEPTDALIAAATRGDLAAVHALVAGGANINGRAQFGDTVLMAFLSRVYHEESSGHRHDTTRELLRLGADPRLLGDERSGPLSSPMWEMDTDMLRLLIDGGADPNNEAGDSPSQSFYDLAVFDYGYEVWGIGDWPETPTTEDKADPDAWLRFLDALAVKHGRRRPDHLRLLRERGAKTAAELRALGQWPPVD